MRDLRHRTENRDHRHRTGGNRVGVRADKEPVFLLKYIKYTRPTTDEMLSCVYVCTILYT